MTQRTDSQLDLLTPDFDGRTYARPLDHARLSTSLARVYSALSSGLPWTLPDLAAVVGCSEAGASARIRDLRKLKFKRLYPNGGIVSSRLAGGLWTYRMVPPLAP
jgi:hypothetical protein